MAEKILENVNALASHLLTMGVRVLEKGVGLAPMNSFPLNRSMILETPIQMGSLPGYMKRIGRHTFIGRGSSFQRVSSIGAYCAIAKDVQIGAAEHPTTFLSVSNLFYANNAPTAFLPEHVEFMKKRAALNLEAKNVFARKWTTDTTIGNDVWIGAGVRIKRGVSIGDGAVVGGGAMVTKNVAPYTIVGGVPAKVIGKRFSDDLIERLLALKWWELPESDLVDIRVQDVEGSVSLLEDRKAKLVPHRIKALRIRRVAEGFSVLPLELPAQGRPVDSDDISE